MKLTIIALFIFISFNSFSQNIKWNPPIRVADRANQLYLGKEGNYYCSKLFYSNTTIIKNSNFRCTTRQRNSYCSRT